MKKPLKYSFFYFILLTPLFGYGVQDTCTNDSTCWRAHIVVEQPWRGLSDTLTVGIDSAGGLGYQSGLDKIDTNFTSPLSIRGYDSIVASNFSCRAIMKKDVRQIEDSLVFSFFVKSDTFNSGEQCHDYPKVLDSCWLITWNSKDFKFTNQKYRLEFVSLYSYGGYMDAIDKSEYCIKYRSSLNCDVLSDTDTATILYEAPGIIGNGGCLDTNYVMRFDLVLEFKNLTNIIEYGKANSYLDIKNNRGYKILNISFTEQFSGNLKIYDYMGRVVFNNNLQRENNYKINYDNLENGFYFLAIQKNKRYVYKFMVWD